MNPISISPPVASPVMSSGIAAQTPALAPQDGGFAAVFTDAPLAPDPTAPKAEEKPDTPLDAEDITLALPIPMIWQQAMTPPLIPVAPDTTAAAQPPLAPEGALSAEPAIIPAAIPPLANAHAIAHAPVRAFVENSASDLPQGKTDTPTNAPQAALAPTAPDTPTPLVPNAAMLQRAATNEPPRDSPAPAPAPAPAELAHLEQAPANAASRHQNLRPAMPPSAEQPTDSPPPIAAESLIQKPKSAPQPRQESQAELAFRVKTAPPQPLPQTALQPAPLPEHIAATPQSHFEPADAPAPSVDAPEPITAEPVAAEPVAAENPTQPPKRPHTPLDPTLPQPDMRPDLRPIAQPEKPVSALQHAGQSTHASQKETAKETIHETNDLITTAPPAEQPKPGMTVAFWGIDTAAQPAAFTPPPFAQITAMPPPLPMMPNPRPMPLAPTLAKIARDTTTGAVELSLAPAELGRLHMAISHDGDMVRVTLSAERPETLDLLRRNADQLTQEFKQAGFAGSSLSFGQWGAGNSNPQQQSQDPNPVAETPGPVFTASPQSALPRAAIGTSGLDLRL